ncbi:MAG: FAD-binding oxidoreductase [Bacillota bacterium]
MQLSEVLYGIGQWSGILAFVSLAFLIFSGDTARYTDRYFGLDRIIKFQRKFSFFVASLVFFHPFLFVLSGQSFTHYLIPSFYVLPLAFGTLSFYIFVAVMLFSHYYKRISYTAWQYIHVLTYALLFLVLYHAFFWGSHSGNILIRLIYIIFGSAVLVGAAYRTDYKLKEMKRGKFRVKNIRWESDDIYTVAIDCERPFAYKAGQFCFLRLNQDKLYARHPFTISSAPGDKELLFSIKNTGRFTAAVSKLQPGDEIMIDGPFGRFVEKKNLKDVVMIAGGVGITPFRSLLRDFNAREKNDYISLLYCAKTEKDLVFRQEFDSLKKDKFAPLYVLSNEAVSKPDYYQGRISPEVIKDATRNMAKPTFYICGPEGLKNTAKDILGNMGVSKHDIVVEDFFW